MPCNDQNVPVANDCRGVPDQLKNEVWAVVEAEGLSEEDGARLYAYILKVLKQERSCATHR
jgi:hypothetical protein